MLVATRSFRWSDVALPPLQPNWVRVRIGYCGLCGSDLSMFEGRRPLSYPMSLGHEFVGQIEAVGEDVKGHRVGDVVTSDLNYRCRTCDMCVTGRSHLCRQSQAHEFFTNRAFSTRADIDAGVLLGLSTVLVPHLCLVEPLSCVLHALDWARPTPEERILVVGAGGIGCCMAFALSEHLRSPFEITDTMPARLARLDAAVRPLGTVVDRPTGEYDLVLDTSGTDAGLLAACAYVRPGGRLCSMSHIDASQRAADILDELTCRDVTLRISFLNGEPENMARAATMLGESWSSPWDSLLEIVPLADIQGIFERRRSSWACKTILAVEGS
jgi:threonine dehydrogenase-like Zn-dependent dehydrogenase